LQQLKNYTKRVIFGPNRPSTFMVYRTSATLSEAPKYPGGANQEHSF